MTDPLRPLTLDELWLAQGFNRYQESPVSDTPISIDETLRATNLRTHLELEALKHGTDDQVERYAARLLPEEELTQIARAILFKGFGDLDLRRWSSRNRDALANQLKHRQHEATAPDDFKIEFETADPDALTPDEWRNLKKVRELAAAAAVHPWLDPARTGGKVEVTPLTHWATCPVCKAEVYRSTVKVSIHWAGRVLVREWTL